MLPLLLRLQCRLVLHLRRPRSGAHVYSSGLGVRLGSQRLLHRLRVPVLSGRVKRRGFIGVGRLDVRLGVCLGVCLGGQKRSRRKVCPSSAPRCSGVVSLLAAASVSALVRRARQFVVQEAFETTVSVAFKSLWLTPIA